MGVGTDSEISWCSGGTNQESQRRRRVQRATFWSFKEFVKSSENVCAEPEFSIQLWIISVWYHCFRGDGTLSVEVNDARD